MYHGSVSTYSENTQGICLQIYLTTRNWGEYFFKSYYVYPLDSGPDLVEYSRDSFQSVFRDLKTHKKCFKSKNIDHKKQF